MGLRVGIGYDSHRLVEGERLVIGGVEIEHDRGLTGHSDADVLTHAVIDALLGASGLGDLGELFPDDEEEWRDANSIDLLRVVVGRMSGRGRNVDVDADLRGAEARPPQGGDLLPAQRRPLGSGQREGVDQRGDGRDRQRRGNRLHRRRSGRYRRGITLSGMAQDRLREGLTGIASRVPAALGDAAFELKTFNDVGLIRPIRPDKLAQDRRALLPLGRLSGARRPPRMRSAYPDGSRSSTRPAPSPGSETHRRSNALARALRDEGIEMGDGVAIMCRNHRYFIEATMACAEARRRRALPQHRLRRAAAGGRDRAREARGADLRPGVHRSALRRRRRAAPLRRLGGRSEGTDETTLEQLISGVARRGPRAALRARPLHHPHLRHDRHPEGRPAQPARGPGLPGGAVLEDPAPLRRDGDDRRAPVPLLGLPALHAQPADRGDDGPAAAASTRRTRCGRPPSTAPGSSRSCPVMMQRILALPDEVKRRYDLSSLEVTAASGSVAAGRARDQVDGRVRRQPLQPLRLDRGRLGDDRDAGGHARRARHGGQAAARHGDPDRRRGRQRRRRRARPAGSSSATSSPSRAIPAAATRSISATCSPPATSATSTRTAASSSTGETTR